MRKFYSMNWFKLTRNRRTNTDIARRTTFCFVGDINHLRISDLIKACDSFINYLIMKNLELSVIYGKYETVQV